MKQCHSAGVSWRLALIEFLSTPGPDGKSPAVKVRKWVTPGSPSVVVSENY